MKGRVWAVVLAVILAARGAGILPRGQEMEELALITALAVDQAGHGVTVTAVTGVRASQGEEPEVLTGAGKSMAAACRAMELSRATRPYLGQAERLLLGEAQAETGLGETLEFVLADGELRLDTLFYIVRGEAGASLAAAAPETAQETPGEDRRGRTVGETLSRLTEGEYALIPALAPGGEGRLAPAGWAVAGPEGLAGFLEGEAALGADLLAGLGDGEVISLSSGALELTGARCLAKGGRLRCALTAQVSQGEGTAEELEAWGTRCVRAALAPGWDCWGLTRQQRVWAPWTGEQPGAGALDVEVTGKVEGSYGRRA